jgi:hypothetical protein
MKIKNILLWESTGNLKKDILAAILYILKAYVLAAAVIILLQRFFLYQPMDDWATTPDQYGAQTVSYRTADGIGLTSWFCPPKQNSNNPVLVMFHGNAGNISHRAYKQNFFCKQGFGFLLAEYRGYGGNEGSPSETGLYSDARAALKWLGSQQGIETSEIILYGESVGSGVATQMALENQEIKALILEAPFTSVPDAMGDVLPWLKPFGFMVLDKYHNLSKAPYLEMPVFILHGNQDSVIPHHHGQSLYEKISAPKDIKIFDGGGHNNLVDYGLLPEIQTFIDQL